MSSVLDKILHILKKGYLPTFIFITGEKDTHNENAKHYILSHSLFLKTLPKSSLQMHWISVWSCGMGDIIISQ